ncbi:MAG TPA: hypothetical protein VG817_11105 [Gemmatimonadales bacterium]|nr:hypothetical protein [Gemmatimonadales bacterium]
MKTHALHPTRYIATLVVAAGAAAIVGMRNAPKDKIALPTLTIVAKDFGYEVPAEVPSGPTRLMLTNSGQELHHAQLVRLEDGKTLKDLASLPEGGPPPSWMVPVGGPGAVEPGQSSAVVQPLVPGTYAIFCFIPSPSDHKAHLAKGMVAGFTVVPAQRMAAMPKADVTVRMVDFGYAPSAPLVAGKRTIKVVNDGPQLHELVLFRLAPGKTLADFAKWNPETATEPPPGHFIGGTVAMAPGGESLVEATVEAGQYVLVCYIPDAKDGKPHFAHGMMMPLTVAPAR